MNLVDGDGFELHRLSDVPLAARQFAERWSPSVSLQTVDELLTLWVRTMANDHRDKPMTVERYSQAARRLREQLCHCPIWELPSGVELYRSRRGEEVADHVVEWEINRLRHALRLAHNLGKIPEVPTLRTRRVVRPWTADSKTLDREQIARLLRLTQPGQPFAALGGLVRLGIFAGLRMGESLAARWRWVDLEARILTVRREKDFSPKGHHERQIPLARQLADWMGSRYGRPREFICRSAGGIQRRRTRAVRAARELFLEAGCYRPGLTSHALRHSFATELHGKGVPLRTIQRLLGHASLETTAGYLHTDNEAARRGVESLDF